MAGGRRRYIGSSPEDSPGSTRSWRIANTVAAAQYTDDLTARWAWILVSAIAIGYMLSRGLAKSGARESY